MDFLTGGADILGFGLGRAIRNSLFRDMGWNDNADTSSDEYRDGQIAGFVLSVMQGVMHGISSASRAMPTVAVIGKHAPGTVQHYASIGQAFNFARFNLPPTLYAALQRARLDKAVNMAWMEIQIKLGRTFVLATELVPGGVQGAGTVTGAYAAEISYLLRRGYQIVGGGEAGTLLVPML